MGEWLSRVPRTYGRTIRARRVGGIERWRSLAAPGSADDGWKRSDLPLRAGAPGTNDHPADRELRRQSARRQRESAITEPVGWNRNLCGAARRDRRTLGSAASAVSAVPQLDKSVLADRLHSL